MKNRIVTAALLSMLCAMVLTGCRISINTGSGKEPMVDVEVPGINVKVDDFGGKEESETKGSNSEESAEDVKSFAVENEMGDVAVEITADSKISVDYEIRVSGRSKEDCKEIADTVTVHIGTADGVTTVRPVIDGNKEIGKYAREKYGEGTVVTVDLRVKIPSKYSELSILDAMGNIEIDGFKGKLSVKNAMGNVNVSKVTFTGDSTIDNAMGDIKVRVDGVTEKATLKMESAMGDVEFDTNGLSTSAPVEKRDGLSGSFSFTLGALLEVEGKTAMGEAKIK